MDYSIISDDVLIAMYQLSGDEQAFASLVHRYKAQVFTSILLIVKQQTIAEDLLQETFIKVMHNIRSNKYKSEGKFVAWLMRTAYHVAIDFFRKHKKQIVYCFLESLREVKNIATETETDDWEQGYKESVMLDKITSLIAQLPESQREVLILRHYHQLSFQEIAQRTQVSINTALGRMRYALLNLRKLLAQNPPVYEQDLHPS